MTINGFLQLAFYMVLLIALANLLIDLFIGYLNPRTIAQGVL